jgi:hypothetical protein
MPAPFKTKKAALEALRAAPVVKAEQIGGRCYEDWDAIKSEARAAWESQGYTVTETGFHGREMLEATHPERPGVATRITRPALPRVRLGRFDGGSTRYGFSWGDHVSSGDVSALKLTPDGDGLQIETFTPGVFIRYTIES